MSNRNVWRGLLALALPVSGAVAWSTFASADDSITLSAALRGRTEVGTGATNTSIVGDPNGRGFVTVSNVAGDPTTLCYVLTVEKIEPAMAAHIHKAPAGVNGGIVVNLIAPSDGSSADCVTEGEAGGFVGTQTAADIFANPQDYYVNVHTPTYPGGAVRGQLG